MSFFDYTTLEKKPPENKQEVINRCFCVLERDLRNENTYKNTCANTMNFFSKCRLIVLFLEPIVNETHEVTSRESSLGEDGSCLVAALIA